MEGWPTNTPMFIKNLQLNFSSPVKFLAENHQTTLKHFIVVSFLNTQLSSAQLS